MARPLGLTLWKPEPLPYESQTPCATVPPPFCWIEILDDSHKRVPPTARVHSSRRNQDSTTRSIVAGRAVYPELWAAGVNKTQDYALIDTVGDPKYPVCMNRHCYRPREQVLNWYHFTLLRLVERFARSPPESLLAVPGPRY